MNPTYTYGATTVTELEGSADGAHRLACTRCGENVRYRLREFTIVEARRHEHWCAAHKGQQS